MKIYGFVGPSGTGKSHRAPWIAKEKNIDFIIDDGLLISGGTIIGGRSAKKEKTKIASVKTAVFTSDDHAFEVAHLLKKHNAKNLLILGTSDGMVNKIAQRLGYPGVDEIIHITDIATQAEIDAALSNRRNLGKHVVPVPTMELKKDFSGLYLDPLNVLKKTDSGYVEIPGEKSVVRPTFSYLGKFTISENAIFQLVDYVAKKSGSVAKISRFRAYSTSGGIAIETDLVLIFGKPIPEILSNLKKEIIKTTEGATSLNITHIKLTAKSLV